MPAVEGGRRRIQDAVDSKFERDTAFVRLDMDVAGTSGESIDQQGVDELDHRARIVGDGLERDRLFPAILRLLHDDEPEVLRQILETLGAPLRVRENPLDGGRAGQSE